MELTSIFLKVIFYIGWLLSERWPPKEKLRDLGALGETDEKQKNN